MIRASPDRYLYVERLKSGPCRDTIRQCCGLLENQRSLRALYIGAEAAPHLGQFRPVVSTKSLVPPSVSVVFHILSSKCHAGSSVVAVLFRPQHNALGTIWVPQIYSTSSPYGKPILGYVRFSLKSLSLCYLRLSIQTMASRIYLVKSMSSQVGTVECNVQCHTDDIL